jgi:hypothetical protein
LDEVKILNAILRDKEFQKFIISLNQNDQLFDEGIDSLGVSLGDYSDFTKVEKKRKGDRFDHITLLDTGKFYKSFNVTVKNGGFEITADPVKDDSNLYDDFGKDIVGLTPENKQFVIDAIREKIITEIRKQIKLVA